MFENNDIQIMNIKHAWYALGLGDLYDGSQKESVVDYFLDITYNRMCDVLKQKIYLIYFDCKNANYINTWLISLS